MPGLIYAMLRCQEARFLDVSNNGVFMLFPGYFVEILVYLLSIIMLFGKSSIACHCKLILVL